MLDALESKPDTRAEIYSIEAQRGEKPMSVALAILVIAIMVAGASHLSSHIAKVQSTKYYTSQSEN